MSKAFKAIGSIFRGPSMPAPTPLPADDSAAKAQAQATAARDALIARAGAGRSGTSAAGDSIAYEEQQGLMAKKVQRTAASQDLMG